MEPNKNKFKALQKKWYKKLKDSGFVDIETHNGQLKNCHSDRFANYHQEYGTVSVEAKTEYFRLARQLLEENKFDSLLDRKIWELHAEGLSIRTIASQLKHKGHPVYRNFVHKRIIELKKKLETKVIK